MSDVPISELSRQQATERLAQMQAAHDARRASPPPDRPTTAADAKARLDHLTGDKEWGAKLEAGDAETNREFHTLAALAADAQPADQLDNILAGTAERPLMETVTDGQLSTGKLMSAV